MHCVGVQVPIETQDWFEERERFDARDRRPLLLLEEKKLFILPFSFSLRGDTSDVKPLDEEGLLTLLFNLRQRVGVCEFDGSSLFGVLDVDVGIYSGNFSLLAVGVFEEG